MDGEHDIQSLLCSHTTAFIWYFTAHVHSGLIVLTWHTETAKNEQYAEDRAVFVQVMKCARLTICRKNIQLRENTQKGENDSTFPYAIIISSLGRSFWLDSLLTSWEVVEDVPVLRFASKNYFKIVYIGDFSISKNVQRSGDSASWIDKNHSK